MQFLVVDDEMFMLDEMEKTYVNYIRMPRSTPLPLQKKPWKR